MAELWLGLLHFYGVDFNIRDCVVSIRQLKPLTKMENGWWSPAIAIEDPFIHTRNLGSQLSLQSKIFMLLCFINLISKKIIRIIVKINFCSIGTLTHHRLCSLILEKNDHL